MPSPPTTTTASTPARTASAQGLSAVAGGVPAGDVLDGTPSAASSAQGGGADGAAAAGAGTGVGGHDDAGARPQRCRHGPADGSVTVGRGRRRRVVGVVAVLGERRRLVVGEVAPALRGRSGGALRRSWIQAIPTAIM